jgi:hypothetical protein
VLGEKKLEYKNVIRVIVEEWVKIELLLTI